MNRLALIAAVLVASTAQASRPTDIFDEFLVAMDAEVYREYACGDRYEYGAEPYVFILVSDQTADGMNVAFVVIGDTPHFGAATQQGLDYRIDFSAAIDLGEVDEDDALAYSIIIQASGFSTFYDFTTELAKESGQTSPSRVLDCERTEQAGVRNEGQEISPTNESNDSGELAVYMAEIRQKIERNWSPPASAGAEMYCSVHVRQVPGGEVVGVTILSCNGDDAVRRSVEAAIYRSSPLPVPSNPDLFDRNILLNLSIGQ